jgi:hypothetical protein
MSRPILKVDVTMTGEQSVKLGLIRIAEPAQRKQAVAAGGIAALNVIKGYYQAKGRPFWVNPALPTHGPGRQSSTRVWSPGRAPTQWWRSTDTAWTMKQANTSSVDFVNGTIGLAHKVTGGTIRAKRKKFLTIPIDPRAHGLTAKTFSRTIAPLFAAKGMLMFVDEQTADVKAAYALKKSITQRPWPGALPPEASYLDAFLDSALDNLLTAFEEA